jgi:TRAP-type C4-dicarboxylate transport system permease small subunit
MAWKELPNIKPGRIEKNIEAYIATILLSLYTILIIYDITLRVVLNSQTLWGFSTVIGLFTWVSWLSASMCIRTDSHLRFTLLRKNLSNKQNFYLRILDVLSWWIVIGAVFYFSVFELTNRIFVGATVIGTSIPSYLFYLSVPVGTALMLFRSVQKIIRISNMYRSGNDVTPDASI